MATFPVSLDGLIEYIRGLHPGGGPLDHLTDAVMAANQLDDQSDAIIGYFVDQARVSGASWSQIGAALGVSKQAAQKRFVVRDEESATEGKTFSRFTPRARASMAAAGRLAAAGGTDAIDVGHLVAGAILDPDGLAARTLDRLEVSPDRIYTAIGVGPAAEGAGAGAEPAALATIEVHTRGPGGAEGSLEGGPPAGAQLHRDRAPAAWRRGRCRSGGQAAGRPGPDTSRRRKCHSRRDG